MFSRKLRREHEELRDRYDRLEDRYEELETKHDRLQHEAGEETNIRISYIEEEIESMNKRVEKLATDSYEIHSEVREIRESVGQMHTALSEIVALYKAIIAKYGFGNVSPSQLEEQARLRRRAAAAGEEPGEEVIRALERERGERARQGTSDDDEGPRSRTVPPRPPKAPPPPPPTPSTLDELHRLAEERKASETEGESLAERIATRSSKADKVDKVARRDMGRKAAIDRGSEGEFTRSLPRKRLAERTKGGEGGDWEALEAPPEARGGSGTGDEDQGRPRAKLEDLLDPE